MHVRSFANTNLDEPAPNVAGLLLIMITCGQWTSNLELITKHIKTMCNHWPVQNGFQELGNVLMMLFLLTYLLTYLLMFTSVVS